MSDTQSFLIDQAKYIVVARALTVLTKTEGLRIGFGGNASKMSQSTSCQK